MKNVRYRSEKKKNEKSSNPNNDIAIVSFGNRGQYFIYIFNYLFPLSTFNRFSGN